MGSLLSAVRPAKTQSAQLGDSLLPNQQDTSTDMELPQSQPLKLNRSQGARERISRMIRFGYQRESRPLRRHDTEEYNQWLMVSQERAKSVIGEDAKSQIVAFFTEIREKSQILKRLNELESEIHDVADELPSLFLDYRVGLYERTRSESFDDYQQKHETKILKFIDEGMKISRNFLDLEKRLEVIASTVFYCLADGRSDVDDRRKGALLYIAFRIWRPLSDNSSPDGWYERCTSFLCDDRVFEHFWKLIEKRVDILEYFIYSHPSLLDSSKPEQIVHRLGEFLPYDQVHRILMTWKNMYGQTAMFRTGDYHAYLKLYNEHLDDLYDLLSQYDKDGKTALHTNPHNIIPILTFTYSLPYREKLLKILTATNSQGQTALHTCDGWIHGEMSQLVAQVKNNYYILYNKPAVLIVYSTRNRPEAESEAVCMHKAFKNIAKVRFEKDKTDEEITDLIEETAMELDTEGLPRSALIVVLMSHGSFAVISDCNGKNVSLSDIEAAMCKNNKLKNRPKILITQCCQIHQIKADEKEAYSPTHPHFCAVMSSIPGQPSTRNIFIPKLAERIEKYRKTENIFKMVARVCYEMESEGSSQTPIIMGTLKAAFSPESI